MNNNEKKNKTIIKRQRAGDTGFKATTIATFPSPLPPHFFAQEKSLPEPDTTRLEQESFKIRLASSGQEIERANQLIQNSSVRQFCQNDYVTT